jgi:hypothetical protein
MFSKICIGKHLSDNFPIQNGPKQGDALSPQTAHRRPYNSELEHVWFCACFKDMTAAAFGTAEVCGNQFLGAYSFFSS